MPSTSLTDYQIMIGRSVTLDADPDTNFERVFTDIFTWPDDLHVSGGARRPLVMFNILPFEDCEFDLFLNARFMVFDMKFDKSHTRNHCEVFSFEAAESFGIPEDRKVEFRINLKKGKARFSDIVIWYQINR